MSTENSAVVTAVWWFGLVVFLTGVFIYLGARSIEWRPFKHIGSGIAFVGVVIIISGMVAAGGVISGFGLLIAVAIMVRLVWILRRTLRRMQNEGTSTKKYLVVSTGDVNWTRIMLNDTRTGRNMRNDLASYITSMGARDVVVSVGITTIDVELWLFRYDGQTIAAIQRGLQDRWNIRLEEL